MIYEICLYALEMNNTIHGCDRQHRPTASTALTFIHSFIVQKAVDRICISIF